jgi:hypothetical protein
MKSIAQCFLPPQHAKSGTGPFAESDEIGEAEVGLEFDREGLDFHVFVGGPLVAEELGDDGLEAVFELPLDTSGEREQVGREHSLEVLDAVGHAAEQAVLGVVFAVERLPVVEAVALGAARRQGVEVGLEHVESGDAHGVVARADLEGPVGLAKKMVGFFDPRFDANQEGAGLAVAGVSFVLNEGVSLVKAARFGVVVVKPLVFEADFVGHGTSELGDFPRFEAGIEGDVEGADLFHGVISVSD